MRTVRGVPRVIRALVAVGVTALTACGQVTAGGGGSGETNWLTVCQDRADCAVGSCVCGICTRECSSASACGAADTCARAGSPAYGAVCGGEEAASPGFCTQACSAENPCAKGLECQAGACVPKRVAAFPGALGFGGRVTGGRGGRVLFVDNLDESGPGSLQAAVDEQGPRTILFRTSGVIEDPEVLIRSGDLTIAGQTAPGTGIILRGRLVADYGSNVENVIVRHLHVRPDPDGSDPLQFDAIQFSRVRGAILDHVSAAFGIDETVDLFEAQDISVGFSTIESSATEGHPEGVHNHALIAGPDSRNISIYNTLFAHHGTAAPALSGGPAELVGSVLYDVEQAVTHRDPARGRFQYVGNTFRTGPNATLMPFTFDDEREPPDPGLGYYLSGNRVDGTDSTCAAGPVDDPWSTCTHDLRRGATFRVQTAWDDASFPSRVPVPAETAEAAYARVLAEAGAFPRDKVARGVLEDVASRGGQWGANIPGDLGGGRFDPLTLPVDSDADGMPDEWELERGLDPTRGADRNRVLESGYTALEEYLAEVAEQVLAK